MGIERITHIMSGILSVFGATVPTAHDLDTVLGISFVSMYDFFLISMLSSYIIP